MLVSPPLKPRDEASVALPGSIIDMIGNTPLLPLSRIVPPSHSRVLVKLESMKPLWKKLFGTWA
jgi:hypothetical protein